MQRLSLTALVLQPVHGATHSAGHVGEVKWMLQDGVSAAPAQSSFFSFLLGFPSEMYFIRSSRLWYASWLLSRRPL